MTDDVDDDVEFYTFEKGGYRYIYTEDDELVIASKLTLNLEHMR